MLNTVMKRKHSALLEKTTRAKSLLATLSSLALLTGCATAQNEPGFTSLFDGHSLNGWTLVGKHGDGYGVTNGVLYCAKGGGGNLFTEQEFDDFILRLEFKLEDGANNGIGIRAPLAGDAAYLGMEIQILEEGAAMRGKWGKLREEQYHGSVYDLIAAKRGALKPPGEWNTEEITARGRHIKVVVNGSTILDADLNSVTEIPVYVDGVQISVLRYGETPAFLGIIEPRQYAQ